MAILFWQKRRGYSGWDTEQLEVSGAFLAWLIRRQYIKYMVGEPFLACGIHLQTVYDQYIGEQFKIKAPTPLRQMVTTLQRKFRHASRR